jgi:hypothetical protein
MGFHGKVADTLGTGSRTPGIHFARGARSAALAAMLVGATIAGPARAGEAGKIETIGCSAFACVDTFELRCPQASSFLCITITPDESDDFQSYSLTAVATAPSTMTGQAYVRNFGDAQVTQCLQRPQREGTMKALAMVTGSGGPGPLRYELSAECFAGDFVNGLESKKTTFSLKQDE